MILADHQCVPRLFDFKEETVDVSYHVRDARTVTSQNVREGQVKSLRFPLPLLHIIH